MAVDMLALMRQAYCNGLMEVLCILAVFCGAVYCHRGHREYVALDSERKRPTCPKGVSRNQRKRAF